MYLTGEDGSFIEELRAEAFHTAWHFAIHRTDRMLFAHPDYPQLDAAGRAVLRDNIQQQALMLIQGPFKELLYSEGFIEILQHYLEEGMPVGKGEGYTTVFHTGSFGVGKSTTDQGLRTGTMPRLAQTFHQLTGFDYNDVLGWDFEKNIWRFLHQYGCGYDPKDHARSFAYIRPQQSALHQVLVHAARHFVLDKCFDPLTCTPAPNDVVTFKRCCDALDHARTQGETVMLVSQIADPETAFTRTIVRSQIPNTPDYGRVITKASVYNAVLGHAYFTFTHFKPADNGGYTQCLADKLLVLNQDVLPGEEPEIIAFSEEYGGPLTILNPEKFQQFEQLAQRGRAAALPTHYAASTAMER